MPVVPRIDRPPTMPSRGLSVLAASCSPPATEISTSTSHPHFSLPSTRGGVIAFGAAASSPSPLVGEGGGAGLSSPEAPFGAPPSPQGGGQPEGLATRDCLRRPGGRERWEAAATSAMASRIIWRGTGLIAGSPGGIGR